MKFIQLTVNDLVWPPTNTEHSFPSYTCGCGTYKRSFYVDPHPCYAHNADLVQELLERCIKRMPLTNAADAVLCSLDREFIGRNNGLTYEEPVYRRPDGSEWNEEMLCYCGCEKKLKLNGGQAHTIVICGKRIPPMPSLTRYLVTHEYGHAVFNQKRRLLGYSPSDSHLLTKKYMALRGILNYEERPNERWHRLIIEVIANDFRTAVMNTELEFWPHDQYEGDIKVPKLNEGNPATAWWEAQTREEMEELLAPFAGEKHK